MLIIEAPKRQTLQSYFCEQYSVYCFFVKSFLKLLKQLYFHFEKIICQILSCWRLVFSESFILRLLANFKNLTFKVFYLGYDFFPHVLWVKDLSSGFKLLRSYSNTLYWIILLFFIDFWLHVTYNHYLLSTYNVSPKPFTCIVISSGQYTIWKLLWLIPFYRCRNWDKEFRRSA